MGEEEERSAERWKEQGESTVSASRAFKPGHVCVVGKGLEERTWGAREAV